MTRRSGLLDWETGSYFLSLGDFSHCDDIQRNWILRVGAKPPEIRSSWIVLRF